MLPDYNLDPPEASDTEEAIQDLIEAWSCDPDLILDDLDHEQLLRLLKAIVPCFDSNPLYPDQHFRSLSLRIARVVDDIAAEIVDAS